MYKLNASNFSQLAIKFSIKLHTGQINDCLFIEQDPLVTQRNDQKHSSSSSVSSILIKSKNHDGINTETGLKIHLPFICSVSNDNWIKIYSLEDRSLFRSHNVSNFSLSSVDCIQLKTHDQDNFDFTNNDDEASDLQKNLENLSVDFYNDDVKKVFKRSLSNDSFFKTLLFLSCWDNSMYIYDMNYNRCIHTLSNSHDDAISRVRLVRPEKVNKKSHTLIVTSSWDSSIKIWRTPSLTNKQSNENRDFIRTEYISELGHDSAVVDFQLSNNYLASICEDGNLYMWKMKLNDGNLT